MKRIAVPVSDELYDACTVLTEAQGGGRGRVLAEILQQAEPMLIASAAGYRAAKQLHGEQRETVLRKLEQMAAAMTDQLNELPEGFAEDLFRQLGAARSAVESFADQDGEGEAAAPSADAREARAARGADADQPPRTNRGVHSEI